MYTHWIKISPDKKELHSCYEAISPQDILSVPNYKEYSFRSIHSNYYIYNTSSTINTSNNSSLTHYISYT